MSASWRESARRRLPEHLDAQGDLAPPWAAFPDYEYGSLGWRMGAGEDWLGLWHVFLERLAPDAATREAYLRRHPPAPINWWGSVFGVLHPDAPRADFEDESAAQALEDERRRAALEAAGLIASDAAYSAWLRKGGGAPPWRHHRTPRDAARYSTRELWFWSRQMSAARAADQLAVPPAPWAWRGCMRALADGAPGRLTPRRGLLTLARMLCAGEVIPPWRLGLSVDDFKDSFDIDMGYVDAFRLWGMCAFDDAAMATRFSTIDSAPPEWRAWAEREFELS